MRILKRKQKHKKPFRKRIAIALYIVGAIAIILGILDVFPDLGQCITFQDITVSLLFLIVINMKSFLLLTAGLISITIGIVLNDD